MRNKASGDDVPIGQALAIIVGFVLIAFIVGTLAFSQGVEHQQRAQTRLGYADVAKQRALSDCSEQKMGETIACVYDIVVASQEQARAEQNLTAQTVMARSASIMTMFAVLSFFTTVVGIYLLKKTLDATQETVTQSVFATNAMVRQNQLSEQTQRAWLSVELTHWGPLKFNENGQYQLHYGLKITNHGSVPALAVSPSAEILRLKAPDEVDFEDFINRTNRVKKFSHKSIPPNGSVYEQLPGQVIDCEDICDDGLWPNKSLPQILVGVTYVYPEAQKFDVTALSISPGVVFTKRNATAEIPIHQSTFATYMT